MRPPFACAIFRPSWVRLMIRKRSSSAIADIIAIKPRPIGVSRSIAAVENFDRGSGVDHGLDNLQAIPHRAGCPVPFGNYQLVARVEFVEGFGERRSSGHVLAGRLVGINRVATEALERLGLPRQVLLLRTDASVTNQPFCGV